MVLSLFQRKSFLAVLHTLFFDEYEIYRLFGEICGNYKNIPDGNNSMYQKFGAEADDMRITENVMKVMSISRNNVICEVNFDRVPLPFNLLCNVRFSQNGEYPCRIRAWQSLYV